ncbi:penicillin-binding protein activator [Legionella israelensis]|uniref:Lipoprotein n=1 Tax=Legionella israelensis TaxID=454 RepID=A0A0W0V2V2_9GAMM|nr:penicillin-binding protein activator [Legionella israelensis]KTD14041.1 lipoprotein [Legionella israelensis]QBS09693.1 penicillin-binding protein activator [Legionella israelensis]SCY04451.1 hypothetical protein SAMN02746069_01095 [Legionella israelensis DSM 19235]STX60632.1 Lipoprotein [Legionella israelensis]
MLTDFFNYRFLLLLFLFALCQCTKVSESHLQVNQQLASPYTLSAVTYLDMANQQEGNDKQSSLIMAAGRMIHDGHWRKGLDILTQTSSLTMEQTNEKYLLQAKVDLMRERPQAAILKLASIHKHHQLPLYHQIQYHEMLAQAYQSSGKEIESVSERIKLERLLPDEASRENNRRALWLSLSRLPIGELNALAAETVEDNELQGWIQLAVIPRQYKDDSASMMRVVQEWLEEHPQHPAHQILPGSLSQLARRMYTKPKQVALLLPLSSTLAGPGKAVNDGFMAARKASDDPMNVRLYDTDKAPVDQIYQQALMEGADYVVGPLSKSDVAIIAALNHPVPTLLLNDPDSFVKENAYVFGLSPVNEAKQVAAKARQNGNTQALIISPSGHWGKEVTSAFTRQWEMNGGRIADTLYYEQNEDMNIPIRNFLQITQSQARGKQLKKLFGKRLEIVPRRRQDFDMIFLLAYPGKARQIVPLLKYYYAGDVPIYATSSVFAGTADTMKDRDLNGVIFCDMPWVFTHQAGHRNWPEQLNSYNRLYALGMDSYALATQLNQLMLFPTMGASDSSGILYLKGPQQIARILEWGQIRQGLAVPLEKTA